MFTLVLIKLFVSLAVIVLECFSVTAAQCQSMLSHNCLCSRATMLSYMLFHLGAEDIVTPNLKLILGLVWTLILHYQIALGLAGEEVVTGGTTATPKQALLAFVNVSCTGVAQYISPLPPIALVDIVLSTLSNHTMQILLYYIETILVQGMF